MRVIQARPMTALPDEHPLGSDLLGDPARVAAVRRVLQGGTTRTGMRGEVWGAGEVEESAHNTDGEEDWAGEGVPWEVAEL